MTDARDRLLARIAEVYVIRRTSGDSWLITGAIDGASVGAVRVELSHSAFDSYFSWLARTTDDNDVTAAIETVFIHVDEAIASGVASSRPVKSLGVRRRPLGRGRWFVEVS